MAKVKLERKDIEVVIIYDTREVDLDYIKTIKHDARIGKDGIKIIGCEREICKPNNCKVSTGDVTFKYRIKDSQDEWTYSKFCAEIKKNTDQFSSLHMKANRDRLYAEIDRAIEYNLDFHFLITDDITELNSKIMKIPKFKYSKVSTPTHTHFANFMKFNEYLKSKGLNQMLCTGKDIGFVLRRLIKEHIIKNKLQY